ncbi:Tda2p [Saccharomyces paradoxus]|uniref:Topoisomerase I damage affected protein 2 n=1 Tax=Saccharomyces paradoxus TaxID=27291 RepID=A0A8B8UQ50_SACPA|nr:Tda2 [Saccharomyces paradoxus]QHS72857.1 Tda2 [Saccharomyces paradoxus]
MQIEIKDGRSDNSPLPEEKLVWLIQESYDSLRDDNETDPSTKSISNLLIKLVLEKLEKHSSLYKYIVTVTTLDIGELSGGTANFSLKNDTGASWQSKKDGIFNYKLEDENDAKCYLMTILWLHK